MRTPVTVAEAAITTCAVEIKMLTVSDKQMTQAVFKQLRREPLSLQLESSDELSPSDLGERYDTARPYDRTVRIWGWVNYHWPKCWVPDWITIEELERRARNFRAYDHDIDIVFPLDHIHFIYQNGSELFRDDVYEQMFWRLNPELGRNRIVELTDRDFHIYESIRLDYPQLFIAT